MTEPAQPSREPELDAPDSSEDRGALPLPLAAPLARASTSAAITPASASTPAAMPAVQAAAVAAGGFFAGAAVVGFVHRRRRRAAMLAAAPRGRRLGGRGRGPGRAAELVQIVGSRSLLVDVHLLGGSSER
ncbi:MAG TPA: hypothetical protein VKV16_03885 [Solirubrobacteraceae bacterium]|nr:hypothetical protein [Solirubrobacteraceae bacterium]